MEPSKEFDKLFEVMKNVERSEDAKQNSWLSLKSRIDKKRKPNIFPALISLAIIAIASFLFITFTHPSETEKTAQSLTNEDVIKAVLEREYNGPNMEINRLMDEWWDLQSTINPENPEEYDQQLQSKEYKDLMNYYPTTFGEYFTDNMLRNAISSNMVFKYNHLLIDNDIEMHLENVQIAQEKDHPNIYRPIIEVSLTNRQGQKISHTLKEEFIFSTSEPGKIGSYNGLKDGGSMELQQKISYFSSYVEGNEEVRTPSIDISFDTLCFNGRSVDQEEKVEFKSGCTAAKKKINSILENFNPLSIKEATEKESSERSEALSQIDHYQISLTNKADPSTLYTITLYEDGFLMFAPGQDVGISGDITIQPHIDIYEKLKIMLDEFTES